MNPLDRPVCSRSVGEPLAEQHCHRLECRLRCLELASTLRRSGACLAKVTVQAEKIHCHRSPSAVRVKLLVSFAHTTWIVAIFLYLSTVARMRVRGYANARRLHSFAFFSARQVCQGSSLVFSLFFVFPVVLRAVAFTPLGHLAHSKHESFVYTYACVCVHLCGCLYIRVTITRGNTLQDINILGIVQRHAIFSLSRGFDINNCFIVISSIELSLGPRPFFNNRNWCESYVPARLLHFLGYPRLASRTGIAPSKMAPGRSR